MTAAHWLLFTWYSAALANERCWTDEVLDDPSNPVDAFLPVSGDTAVPTDARIHVLVLDNWIANVTVVETAAGSELLLNDTAYFLDVENTAAFYQPRIFSVDGGLPPNEWIRSRVSFPDLDGTDELAWGSASFRTTDQLADPPEAVAIAAADAPWWRGDWVDTDCDGEEGRWLYFGQRLSLEPNRLPEGLVEVRINDGEIPAAVILAQAEDAYWATFEYESLDDMLLYAGPIPFSDDVPELCTQVRHVNIAGEAGPWSEAHCAQPVWEYENAGRPCGCGTDSGPTGAMLLLLPLLATLRRREQC